jgi:hypothetical protein
MVIMPQQNLAIYTCKTGAKQGPAGPTGEPGTPYMQDTIICQAAPEYAPLVVDLVTPATHFRAPYPLEIGYVRCSLAIAPVGADVIIDITMNGSSIFTPGNLLHIDAGSKTSVGSVTPPEYAIVSVPDDAEFLVWITQVGSSLAGAGPKISVTGTKVA